MSSTPNEYRDEVLHLLAGLRDAGTLTEDGYAIERVDKLVDEMQILEAARVALSKRLDGIAAAVERIDACACSVPVSTGDGNRCGACGKLWRLTTPEPAPEPLNPLDSGDLRAQPPTPPPRWTGLVTINGRPVAVRDVRIDYSPAFPGPTIAIDLDADAIKATTDEPTQPQTPRPNNGKEEDATTET